MFHTAVVGIIKDERTKLASYKYAIFDCSLHFETFNIFKIKSFQNVLQSFYKVFYGVSGNSSIINVFKGQTFY